MTRTQAASAGIVISASHNPFEDNGIKFFGADGAKLPDHIEHAIEDELEEQLTTVGSREIGKVLRVVDAAGRYIEFCKSTVPENFKLRGLRIGLDCAHGATYHIAPSVLSELGAEVITMGVQPDGFNINEGVGSTDITALAELVRAKGVDLGIAFDGDGDRVLFVDADGETVDGDELVYLIAIHRLATGHSDAGVVGTQMSNLGLELALRDAGLRFVRAKVGDRYVKEMMEKEGWHLGGESSGHIICSDITTTGDGIVAALQVLIALKDSGGSFADLRAGMKKFPQTMINVTCGRQGEPGGLPSPGRCGCPGGERIGRAGQGVAAALRNRTEGPCDGGGRRRRRGRVALRRAGRRGRGDPVLSGRWCGCCLGAHDLGDQVPIAQVVGSIAFLRLVTGQISWLRLPPLFLPGDRDASGVGCR